MTEEEAKTKWCPFARVAKVDVGIGYNRWVDGIGESIASNSNCIGSACMAWRKTGVGKVENNRGQLVERDIDGTGRWHYLGYCGLAGKSEHR